MKERVNGQPVMGGKPISLKQTITSKSIEITMEREGHWPAHKGR